MAVKILDKSKLDAKTQRMLSREISSMEKLHHPNLVRLFEVIETFSKIYLVIEFASGGELFQKISTEGRFDEYHAKPLFAQIVSAIDHMVSELIMTQLSVFWSLVTSIPMPPLPLLALELCSNARFFVL